MGEVAEDVMDGMLCQHCGEWFADVLMGADAPGYPRSCARCKHQDKDFHPQPPPEKVSCDICHKRVKATGLHDHKRAVHGPAAGVGEGEGK
jgi:hypothetical protein